MSLEIAQIEFDDQGRLISRAYDDIYFQPKGSRAESNYVFIEQGHVHEKFSSLQQDVTIAELGFGTGLNFLLTAEAWSAHDTDKNWLHYISFEKHPIRKSDLTKIHDYWPDLKSLSSALINQYPFLTEGLHRLIFPQMRVTLTLVFGDVTQTLPEINFGQGVDVFYLDGFAPAKNPDMWADDLWGYIGQAMKPEGRVTTFTAAAAVKRGLIVAGFEIDKVKGFGRKRQMLVGLKKSGAIPTQDKTRPITIIGAGIAGCALAESLTRYGHNVTLIDKYDKPARGTSGNLYACVYPKLTAVTSPMDRLYRHAFSYTQNFYRQLSGHSFHQCGVMQIDKDADAKTRHQKIITRALPNDLVRYLDETETHDISGVELNKGGLFYPKGGMVSPSDLCHALLAQAERNDGALTVRFNHTWNGAVPNDSASGITILTQGEDLKSTVYTKNLNLEIVRGQTSVWAGNDISQSLKTILCHKGYITPAVKGLHCLGSTFDKGQSESNADTPENHVRNMDQLFEHVPSFKSDYNVQDLNGRTGNRLATNTRLPLAGLLDDNLYVLGALGSHGFTTAPFLAEILASRLSNAPQTIDNRLVQYLSPKPAQ